MIPAVPDSKPKATARSGIVTPHELNLPRRFLTLLISLLVRLLSATLRYEWQFPAALLANQNRPVVFCTWHNRLALAPIIYRAYIGRFQQTPRLATIVSASRDGAIFAGVLKRFGIEATRGSSSKRGAQAFLELLSTAEQGFDLAVTPDGPRGPRYVVQPGVIALAQATGRPIIPFASTIRWKVCLNSWDRFQIPLPFSRAIMKFGEPMIVPPDQTNDDHREDLRTQLQRRLDALTVD